MLGELAERFKELGPEGAWLRTVDTAIESDVDAVALAGDVVEGEYDFFEAYRMLANGVKRLHEADIRVLGVAGNHDVQVLPRLADQIEGFQLLGSGGEWQRETLATGGEHVTVHGWSFPRSGAGVRPLSDQSFERGLGPNLGLLHCDRDQVGSAYAPVSTTELNSADLDGWLLGHIHAPDPLTAEHPAGYLGSVTGLDPGEPGARGPWLITIKDGQIASIEQWTLAPLRWERLSVDLTGIESPEDARDRLLNATNELDRTLLDGGMSPEAVGLRLTFTGRTSMRHAVEELFVRENLGTLYAGSGRIRYFVECQRYDIQPELDMPTLAQRADPPGLIARRLQILDRPPEDAERRELLKAARLHLAERAKKPYWTPLDDATQDDKVLTGWLRRSGLAALDQLLAQREGAE